MELCLTTSPDWKMTLDLLVDIAQILGFGVAAAGLVYLVRGFPLWRRTIVGQSEHDVARNVLLEALKVREEIRAVRLGGALVRQPDPELAGSSQEEQRLDALKRLAEVYEKRLARLRERLTELQMAALAAEALWQKEARTKVRALEDCAHEVGANVWEYFWLNGLYESLDAVDRNTERVRKNREFMWDRSGAKSGPDAFSRQVEAALTEIEKFYRPKLQLEQAASVWRKLWGYLRRNRAA